MAATAVGRRPICGSLALACPAALLALALGLSTSRGTHIYDGMAGDYGSGLVAFGILILVIVALLALGLAFAVASLLRRERPMWIALTALAVNATLAAAGLLKFLR